MLRVSSCAMCPYARELAGHRLIAGMGGGLLFEERVS